VSTHSGEFERIASLSRIYAGTHGAVMLGIGDDCAVLAGSASARVWTVDTAVAGVHFDLAFMPLHDVGYRAFMAAASDVAAMGARAEAALSSLIVPPDLDDAALYALAEGIAAAAREVGASVAGGNLARGRELSITTTVLGVADGRVVTRAGARPGDGVFVTGVLGAAALGLVALRAGADVAEALEPSRARAVRHFLAPSARFDRSGLVSRSASAAIDVSDGLVQDLGHLAAASGVGITVELARVPRVDEHAALALALGSDPVALLLSGGEDYELAFTAPRDAVPNALATCIGIVKAGAGVVVVDEAGERIDVGAGHDHFVR
jgi:thiamine-monophosphate kinase